MGARAAALARWRHSVTRADGLRLGFRLTAGTGTGPASPVPARPGGDKYAVEEELLDHSPAAHVRRRRADHESHAAALDAMSSASCWPPWARPAARACADLTARLERAAGIGGHRRRHRAPWPRARDRTLTITRKGGKVVTVPLAPRTARAIDLAIGERTGGPKFLAAHGRRSARKAGALTPFRSRACRCRSAGPGSRRRCVRARPVRAAGGAPGCGSGCGGRSSP